MTDTLTRPATRTAHAPATLARLTLVELRKLVDTRAGRWLLIGMALAVVATAVIILGWIGETEQRFATFFLLGLAPSAILLPVLGILSMTSEWSQRTALTTFTLTPSRGRVIAAKTAAGVLVALLTVAVTAVFSVAANLVAIALDGNGSWRIDSSLLWQAVIMLVVYVLMGLGFGALLLHSPLAIVLYFAIPTLWTVLGEQISSLHRIAAWADLGITTEALNSPDMTSGQYQRLGVSVAIWVLLPLVLGTLRVMRREVS